MPEPLAYRLKTVAQLLDMSERKVQDLVYTGRMGSVNLGGCRRVTKEQLQAFIDASETNPARKSPGR